MTDPDPLLDEIRRMVADVFQVRLDTVTAESTSETVPGWDSLHHLNLVLALEQTYDLPFDPLEAAELTGVQAVVDAVRSKRGAAS